MIFASTISTLPSRSAALEHAKNSFFTKAKSITAKALAWRFLLRETVDIVRDRWTSPFLGSAEAVAAEITRWFEYRAYRHY